MRRKNEKRFIVALAIVGIAIGVYTSTQAAHALTESKLQDFAANNIMFYDPGGSSSGCVSLPTGEGIATVSGTTAKEKVWSGLRSLGVTEEVTAGIMGNMAYESAFNPARHEGAKYRKYWPIDLGSRTDISYGLGLIQWSYGRRTKVYNYIKESASGLAEKYLDHPETYSVGPAGQVYGSTVDGDAFIAKAQEDEANALFALELTYLVNKELLVYKTYKKVFDETTVEGAAKYFARRVEVCGGCGENGPSLKPRAAKAQEIYDQFHGQDTFDGGTGSGSSGCSSGEDTGEGTDDGTNPYGEGGYDGDDYNYVGDVDSLQHLVKEYAWSTWWEKAGRPIAEQTPAYRASSPKYGGCSGNDCGGYVTAVIKHSGWDKDFSRSGGVHGIQERMFKSNSWKNMTSEIKSSGDMKPGDIILCSHSVDPPNTNSTCHSSNIGHIMLWSGQVDGFPKQITSASFNNNGNPCSGTRAPSTSTRDDIMHFINQGYMVFRKVHEE